MEKEEMMMLARKVWGEQTILPPLQLEKFAKEVLWSDKLFQSLIKGERIAERNRIVELLMELHKQAADSHNHYHYAAKKVKELK